MQKKCSVFDILEQGWCAPWLHWVGRFRTVLLPDKDHTVGTIDMDIDIDKLIIRPGHFVLSPDKRHRIAGDDGTAKLDIFKDKEAGRIRWKVLFK